jgi:hypothetical protein
MSDIILSMEAKEKKPKRTPRVKKAENVITPIETKIDDDELIEDVPKKRKRKPKVDAPNVTIDEDINVINVEHVDIVGVVDEEVVVPKKRGRPKADKPDKVEKEKKPRGRPKVDKWKDIEAKIRKNDFKEKSELVIYISRVLNTNNEYREQIATLLKELNHNEIMMVFSFL